MRRSFFFFFVLVLSDRRPRQSVRRCVTRKEKSGAVGSRRELLTERDVGSRKVQVNAAAAKCGWRYRRVGVVVISRWVVGVLFSRGEGRASRAEGELARGGKKRKKPRKTECADRILGRPVADFKESPGSDSEGVAVLHDGR
jgi:hypothetical protein